MPKSMGNLLLCALISFGYKPISLLCLSSTILVTTPISSFAFFENWRAVSSKRYHGYENLCHNTNIPRKIKKRRSIEHTKRWRQFQSWKRIPSVFDRNELNDTWMSNDEYDNTQDTQRNSSTNIVRQMTINWCYNFVADLGLCPWARQSLMKENCTKIMIIQDPKTPEEFERYIRSAASDLLERTNAPQATNPFKVETAPKRKTKRKENTIDPDYAITFVVIAPSLSSLVRDSERAIASHSSTLEGWYDNFEIFYNFVNQVESDWFDNADEGIDSIGDMITLAGFHPKWAFGSEDAVGYDAYSVNKQSVEGDKRIVDNNDDPTPTDYEKRSPYPTISLVLTEAIHRLTGSITNDEEYYNADGVSNGEEVTNRIAVHNEQILNDMGLDAIRRYYKEKVFSLADNKKTMPTSD